MKIQKKELLRFIKNSLLVLIGTTILAFGTALFIIPFNLVAGGISGISVIIYALSGGAISTTLSITVLTWVLFIIGFFVLGKSFAAKTLLSTLIYPITVSLFGKLLSPNVLDGFFMLDTADPLSLILATIFGGLAMGAGCALTFLGGGSTGGADIIAFILCKFIKKLKASAAIFIIDSIVILLGMFAIKSLPASLLGIVTAFIAAVTIDKLFLTESRAFVAQITTDKGEEINSAVITELDRTTTITNVIGGFSKKEKQLITISFTLDQYAKLMAIVNRIDPGAFIMLHRAHEINGEGFSR